MLDLDPAVWSLLCRTCRSPCRGLRDGRQVGVRPADALVEGRDLARVHVCVALAAYLLDHVLDHTFARRTSIVVELNLVALRSAILPDQLLGVDPPGARIQDRELLVRALAEVDDRVVGGVEGVGNGGGDGSRARRSDADVGVVVTRTFVAARVGQLVVTVAVGAQAVRDVLVLDLGSQRPCDRFETDPCLHIGGLAVAALLVLTAHVDVARLHQPGVVVARARQRGVRTVTRVEDVQPEVVVGLDVDDGTGGGGEDTADLQARPILGRAVADVLGDGRRGGVSGHEADGTEKACQGQDQGSEKSGHAGGFHGLVAPLSDYDTHGMCTDFVHI